MENINHPIDKKIIGHLFFILAAYLSINFWLLDLNSPEQRFLAFHFLFLISLGYTAANSTVTTMFIRQTNYELPYAVSVFFFGIWLSFVDLNYSEVPSCFTAIFLLFSTLSAFLFGSYWAHFRKEKRESEEIWDIDLLPAWLVMIACFLWAMYFLIAGSWKWPVVGLLEALEALAAESSRQVKPLF